MFVISPRFRRNGQINSASFDRHYVCRLLCTRPLFLNSLHLFFKESPCDGAQTYPISNGTALLAPRWSCKLTAAKSNCHSLAVFAYSTKLALCASLAQPVPPGLRSSPPDLLLPQWQQHSQMVPFSLIFSAIPTVWRMLRDERLNALDCLVTGWP